MDPKLENMKVAILLTTGFEQVEMTKPRTALEQAGAVTHLVAPKEGRLKAWDGDDWSETFEVDVPLEEANAGDYDALLLPGGVLNPDHLRANDRAVSFVRAFVEADKPVAAICHGPWTLIEAGAVEGRRMTSYHSIRTDLQNAGAEWVDEAVVRDGRLVTSRNPDDLPDFNEAIVDLFAEVRPEAVAS